MLDEDKLITFMEHHWARVDDANMLTIGIHEEALEDFDNITGFEGPEENAEVIAEEACGEMHTDQGSLALFSPVDGIILEINEDAIKDPSLIQDDCYGDGWILRVEADNENQIAALVPEDDGLGEDPDFADYDE